MDQERANIHKQFGGEAFKWEKMSHDELESVLDDLTDQVGTPVGRLVNKLFYPILVLSHILIWLVGISVTVVLSTVVAEYFPDQPKLRFLCVSLVFTASIYFFWWGLAAEEGKLLRRILSPIQTWGERVKAQQQAYKKQKAIKYYLENKKKVRTYLDKTNQYQ